MQINNINDLCDFIYSWMNIKADLSCNKLDTSIYIPKALQQLYSRLGQLWMHNDHPLTAELNGARRGLFEYQNILIDPRKFKIDEFGVVTFWSENQGVFNYGYVESDNFAYADQDWMAPGLTINDLSSPPSPPDQRETCWGRTPLTLEQTLIDSLFGDLLVMFGTYLSEDKKMSKNLDDVTLWNSRLWPSYNFWANSKFDYITDGTWLFKKE